MAKITQTQKAMRILGSLGGSANVRKHGKGHMRKIQMDRWKKQRAEEAKVDAGKITKKKTKN